MQFLVIFPPLPHIYVLHWAKGLLLQFCETRSPILSALHLLSYEYHTIEMFFWFQRPICGNFYDLYFHTSSNSYTINCCRCSSNKLGFASNYIRICSHFNVSNASVLHKMPFVSFAVVAPICYENKYILSFTRIRPSFVNVSYQD